MNKEKHDLLSAMSPFSAKIIEQLAIKKAELDEKYAEYEVQRSRFINAITGPMGSGGCYRVPDDIHFIIYQNGRSFITINGPITIDLRKIEGLVVNVIDKMGRPYEQGASDKRAVNGQLVDSVPGMI